MTKIKKLLALKQVQVVLNRNEVSDYFAKKTYYSIKKQKVILKDLRVVLQDCSALKRKISSDFDVQNFKNKKVKKETARNGQIQNGNHKVKSSRCSACLQFLDKNLIVHPGDGEDALGETEVIFNQTLSVDTGNAVDYDEQAKQDYKIVDFTIYDSKMHLCAFDSGLIENGNELYLSGVVKPIFDDDRSRKGGMSATEIGPITEWWSSGYDGGSDVIIGVSSEYANYYLITPSNLYAPFMKSTMVKVYLTKLVIEFLENNMNGTYEDLIDNIQVKTPPAGYDNFSEENLIHHAQFILDQITSYDAVADDDEIPLCKSQCLKTLRSLAGVSKEDRRPVTAGPVMVEHKIVKSKGIDSKATTTPLVRKVFETIFRDQIANVQKSQKLKECGGCKKSNCQSCASTNGKKKSFVQEESDSESSLTDYLSDDDSSSDDENEGRFTKLTRRRNSDMCNTRVFWISELTSSEDKTFYRSVKVNGEMIEIGDCVTVNPNKSSLEIFIGRIAYMWENEKTSTKMFHCHWFCHGSETVLGQTDKDNLLFLTDECENVRISDITSKCDVIYKPPPKDWAFRGGNEVENDLNEKNTFYYNKWYQRATARFEDPPYEYIETHKKRFHDYCPCCTRLKADRNKKKVQLEDELIRNSKYAYFDSATWKDVKYSVGDQVFLMPDAFEFDAKPALPKKETKPKIVDETIYTEYFRKRNNGGYSVTNQEPFRIGYLERIYCPVSLSSELVEPTNVMIKVKKFYRPENTHEGIAASYYSDFNLLYCSDEVVEIEFGLLTGKCQVRFCKTSLNSDFCWESNEHKFYFNKMYNAEKKAFEEPSCELKRLGNKSNSINKKVTKQTNGTYTRKLKTMDVFAGCGGLSEGLHQSQVCETLWAIENEESAAKAFKLNNPKCTVYNENCNSLLKMIMQGKTVNEKGQALPRKGEVELLCGGPPCQGFSGMNRFTYGQYSQFKNSLIASYLSYCDFYRPKYFLLENVRNFLSFKQNVVLKLTLQCLIEMGYQCTFGYLQAGCYGVPQSRHRAFIFAAAPGEKLPLFPEPLNAFNLTTSGSLTVDDNKYKNNTQWTKSAPYRSVTVRDSLSDLPPITNGAKVEIIKYCPEKQSHYQKLMRGDMEENYIRHHVCKDMKELVVARFTLIPCEPNSDWRDLPNKEIVLSNGTATKKLIYRYEDGKHGNAKNGALRGVCQCVEDEVFRKCDPLYREPQDNTIIPWCLPHTANRHNNWAGLFGRLDLDSHFKTTITNPEPMGKQGKVVHPNQHRVLSVRECARSQGFPDSYEFYGSILDRHKQVGNAVPPPLARAIGLEIKKCIETKKNSKN